MKVKDAINTLKDIDDVLQAIFPASKVEGTHIDQETTELIRKIMLDYQAYILGLEVHSHADS